MTQYLHHVPGRLRLQTERFQDQRAAAAACDQIERIRGVIEARSNPIIGSVTIIYDRHRLSPSALENTLCRYGFASKPLPRQNGARLARAKSGASGVGTARKWPVDLIVDAVVGKLVERCGAMLLAALL